MTHKSTTETRVPGDAVTQVPRNKITLDVALYLDPWRATGEEATWGNDAGDSLPLLSKRVIHVRVIGHIFLP